MRHPVYQERKERDRRRKNVIIKGTSVDKERMEEGIEKFIREKIGDRDKSREDVCDKGRRR